MVVPFLVQNIAVSETVEQAIYYRGENYELITYSNGTTVWRTMFTGVWNGTHWVDYIFSKDGENYTVQAGLIGARLYKGKVKYYDPNMTTLIVERENWFVYKLNEETGKWKPVCASLERYFDSASFFEDEEYVNVTGTWTTVVGNLTIIYHFHERLKHTVIWTPKIAGKYAVVQTWNGTRYERVKLHNATVIKRTSGAIIGKADALKVFFFNETQPFGIFEDQQTAEDLLHKVIFAGGTVDYQGISLTNAVGWIFYNSTLCDLVANQPLIIDPTTYTGTPGTGGNDGYVYGYSSTYSTAHDTAYGSDDSVDLLYIGQRKQTVPSTAYYVYRGFLKFDTSSIPSNAEITNAKLKLYGSVDASDTDFIIRLQKWTGDTPIDTGDYNQFDGTNYDDGFSTSGFTTSGYNEITISNYDLITKAGNTRICVRSSRDISSTTPSGNEYVQFYSYEKGAGYEPILEVTYTTNSIPTIGQFEAPSTTYANKYFYLNVTINDADGIADFVNATIEISNSVILKWVNSTNTFSEYQDTNNYCTLDASNSVKTSVNSTAYKLSWKIKLTWTYPEGSVNVIVTNTKVFDSQGASGSGSQSGLFTFEDDLIIHTDASVSDSRVNPSQSITFTATIYYQGTTTVPEDVTGITAYVELSGIQKGSDTDVTGGLSITINAESTVNSYNYNIYCVTDENSVQNQTVNVIVDRDTMQDFSFSGGTMFNMTVKIVSEYDGALDSKNVKVRVYLNNSLWDTVDTVTNSSGYASFQVTENLYYSGNLTFDCIDLDDNINSLDKSNYLFSYSVDVLFLNSEVDIDKTSYTQGDTLTMTAYLLSHARINDSVNIYNLKLYNVYWRIVVKHADGSVYGTLNDVANKFNMTYANQYETKTKTLSVTFPEGTYYLTAQLWISGSDYLVNSADSGQFIVHAVTAQEGGAGASPIKSKFPVYIVVADAQGTSLANVNVTVLDTVYNGTVATGVTDNTGTATFNLLEGNYYVIVEYKTEHKEMFITVDEPETFTISLSMIYMSPIEVDLNTESLLLIMPGVLGLILAMAMEHRKQRHISIPLSFISIGFLIYGGFVFFNILPFSLPFMENIQITPLSFTDLTNINIVELFSNKMFLAVVSAVIVFAVVTVFAKVNTSRKPVHRVRRVRRYR